MFDLKQLRCFVRVAEELHFGRAASSMNMTQSPFSRQIRLLEQDLGVQLLDRDSKHVRLTRPGRAFLADARHILQATDMVAAAARQAATGERGTIALGFTTTAGFSLMPEIVALSRLRLPNIALLLREQASEDQVAALAAGMLDVGLVWPASETELCRMPMAAEPLVAALPARDARSRKPSVGARDFHGRPFIMYAPDSSRYLHAMVRGVLAREGCVPRFVQYLPNAHAMLSMVGTGLGAAIVPRSAMRLHLPGVKFVPLRAPGAQAETHAIWSKANPNPALGHFLRIIGALPGRPGQVSPAAHKAA